MRSTSTPPKSSPAEDTKNFPPRNAPPDSVDVLEAKAAFKAAYSAGRAIVDQIEHKLRRLENLKQMNQYQLRDYQESKQLIDIFRILINSSGVVVKHLAYHEAQAYQYIAEAAETELKMIQALQRINQQQKQEIEDLQKLVELLSSQYVSA
ncbi:hypothetical protein [Cesiribacter andamanensis]|uniref:Uncharacterized protein n=1 Tax=Cesiribacter andamanensis AMV16 TaxID=1279009 RepID=M7NL52_9BACT|nr:hypothetical protein [Cesiribacter andamanensis]EMR02525.1 hypothetical protein ADICEAN_02332 [Cesiribacter andamanensis AMV16]